MKKFLLFSGVMVAFLAIFAGTSINWHYGDLRFAIVNHTMRHWTFVEAVKPACAAGFIMSGGYPCGNAGSYAMAGPSSGDINTAYTYTDKANGATGVTATPSDSSHGGVFSPTTVTLSSAPSTFTYTPLQTGTYNLSSTNSGSLTNPSPISFTSNNLLPGYPGFTTGWTSSSSTVTTAEANDPFAGSNAALLTENSATGAYHFIYTTSNVTVVSGQAYNFGIMVKAATGTRGLDANFYKNDSTSGGIISINPAGCSATISSFGGTTISNGAVRTANLGSGWCLALATITPNFTTLNVHLYLTSGGNEVYNGDGVSGLYIYGPFVQ
jgi:hypothetical protein